MSRYLVSLVLISFAIPAFAADLRVGFGEVNVTPEVGKKPVFMAGFGENRRATGVHDPLMARATVLSDGTRKIALVCADVVGLFNPSVERVRAKLAGFDYILVSSTHNHEGPDTLGLWGPNPFTNGVDPAYLKKLEEGLAEAVRKADAALAPAVARIGTAATADLIHDGRLPELKHDTMVVLSFADPKTSRHLGLLVQWNNHPEDMDSKNTEITADFPGVVVAKLKAKYHCPVTYLTGTVGGLMTSLHVEVKSEAGVPLKQGTFERLERYGSLVTERAVKAIESSQLVTLTPFESRRRAILLPMDNMMFRLAWQAGTLSREMFEWNGVASPKEFVQTKDIKRPVASKTELGHLKLGELEVAVIPGEIYPELVLGGVQDPVDPGADFPDAPIEPSIYGQLKSKHKMIVGLGNDELGYFIPKRQWDEKKPFCYGRNSAQYGEINSVGPEAAPVICGEFQKLVAEPAHTATVTDGPANPTLPAWTKSVLPAIDAKIETEKADLLALYTHLHTHPELSLREEKTSQRIAEELRKLGFDVTEKVGGFGVVGVFKNGTGPTVLVRTDTDALPVTEKTGLPYASKVRTKDKAGNDVGVMHACGHDM
ncbi:MAG: hypothetical protein U0798_10805, partial [Gemmataceae bacterium]